MHTKLQANNACMHKWNAAKSFKTTNSRNVIAVLKSMLIDQVVGIKSYLAGTFYHSESV